VGGKLSTASQDIAIQSKTQQHNASQNKTKQNKTSQNKANQNKTIHSKTPQTKTKKMICKNCGKNVDQELEFQDRNCYNCSAYLSHSTVSELKEFQCLKTVKDRVRAILKKYHQARNDDWFLILRFLEHFGTNDPLSYVLRLRAEIQNVDKEFVPTEETRMKRREQQLGMGHRYGGQTIKEEDSCESY